MPYQILNVAKDGVRRAFNAALVERNIVADAEQLAAVERLQVFYDELLALKAARRNRLRKLFIHPELPRGVWFWGGVGRGKSFLMDCFFDAVPYQRKRRVHFHAFMREVHKSLKAYHSESDPLAKVAADIARETRLMCFDEFHVSDIADAMILGRLMKALFDGGVVFCITSNYPPDGLYPNGLQRQNFLPTIQLLNQTLDVLKIDAGIDYRLRTLEQADIFLTGDPAAANNALHQIFHQLAGGEGDTQAITLVNRELPVVRRAQGIIWFDFATLCEGPRSQNDYLALADEYHTLVLSNVPKMTLDDSSAARRFTWLVDVLYDHRVKLIISAECTAEALYTQGSQASEFVRTVSRLIEMRSHEYLASAHKSAVELTSAEKSAT
ncbi:ATPase [Rugosibacter aromaticivorans]|uniref:ATPase n=1 Tax=Rugosibacter aromaticivorans TaxID=1565605 RepID=A0A0C5J8A2_9PROT|nr:cell division protein ZapE [Rugosibacter aromaticivorans]AJP47884.1 ATPase [Rugosibacter aromaticivorans]TBR15019.1 MAG: cell division protein ZapE [Rugosibacter sp.]